MKYTVVAFAVVLAAFLRFYQLDSIPPGLYADEATDGNDAIAAWRSGDFRVFYPEINGREGLYVNLTALAFGLTGRAKPWVLRLPSALLGTLTVLGVYALARQLGLRRTAWLAAWFMATSFWHINISRMGGLRAISAFFLVWSLWLWGVAVATTDQRRALMWAVAAGLVYGLGFHSYQAYRLTPLLILIYCSRPGARPTWRVAAAAGGVAMLTVLPLAVFALRHPDLYFYRAVQLQTLPTAHPVSDLIHNAWRTAGMFNVMGDLNPRHNLPGRAMLFWPVGVLFLAGIIVAARRQRFLLWWLVIGAVPAILASEGIPHSGRAVLAMPAAMLLATLGAEWLAERTLWRVLAPVLAVAVAVEGYRSYFVVWPRDPRVAEWLDSSLLNVAARLDELPRELPKYVILDPDPMIVHGLPFAAQTIMFLTDTATPERQAAKNIHYLWPDQTNQIARGYVFVTHIETTRP